MKLRFAFVIAAALATTVVLGCGTSDDFYVTPDTTPPLAPVIAGSMAGQGYAHIWWEANTEPDLAGYNIYSLDNGQATRVNSRLWSDSRFSVPTDNAVDLYVTAVDVSGNESSPSSPWHVSVNRSGTDHDPIERLPREKPSLN